jgi:hypothetical protein
MKSKIILLKNASCGTDSKIKEQPYLMSFFTEIITEEDLETTIRKKLGQNFDNPQYDKYDRPIHRKIDMGACNSVCNTEIYKNNKEICELFSNDLNSYKAVIYVWKGSVTAYLVTTRNYKKYDYWNDDNWHNGINENLNLPYKYCYNANTKGTVEIIKHLIQISHKI